MERCDLVMMVEGIQKNPQQRLRQLRTECKEYMYNLFLSDKNTEIVM